MIRNKRERERGEFAQGLATENNNVIQMILSPGMRLKTFNKNSG